MISLVNQSHVYFVDMSPSNSTKTLSGDPATYQQMQQALFKFSNNTGKSSEAETGSIVAAEGTILPNVSTRDVSPKSNPKESGLGQESQALGDTKPAVTVTSNLLISTQNAKQNNQQSSGKSVETMSPDRPSLAINVGEKKPIKPKPAVSGIEVVSTVASESKISPIKTAPISTAAVITVNNLPAVKVPERSTPSTKSKGTARRRGKWTVEEEEYVARVIQDFNSGYLNAPAGYTLRSYLSDKLQCDPMRITKKFTGESCIGKRVFHPAVRSAANAAAIDKAQVRKLFLINFLHWGSISSSDN